MDDIDILGGKLIASFEGGGQEKLYGPRHPIL